MILLSLLITGLGMGASASGAVKLSPSGPTSMPGWTVVGADDFSAALVHSDEQYIKTTNNGITGQIPFPPTTDDPCEIEVCLTARTSQPTLSTVSGSINVYSHGELIATTPAFELSDQWQHFTYLLTAGEVAAAEDATDLSLTLEIMGIEEAQDEGPDPITVDVGELCVTIDPCTPGGPGPGGGGGPGMDPPDVFSLEPASGVRLNPRWPVGRVDGGRGVTLETDGPNRHTRNPHERMPRRYELAFHLAPPEEVELVRQALAATFGGASAVGWRHPTDDPPAPAPLTEYRIVNAHESAAAIARAPAGQSAEFTLTFEEV